ncbi:phosphoribosyl-ATP diphosphatase [Aureococcus anophagefferens]|nr:phosphoribosyl-ATP diphosphatase [Aureococcus anophagefferens]
MGGSHDHTLLEEGCELMLDYRKIQKVATCGDDVVPVAVQDVDTREVLILATSRRKLWVKGETSGDYLDLKEVRVNCEQNSLLYLVKPRRTGACHTKDEKGRSRVSCYYRALDGDGWLVKRPPPKRKGYSPEAVFGAFLLGALVATRTQLLFPR